MLDLQKDISEMDAWSATWLIKFNLENCHVLTFGKPKFIAHPYCLRLAYNLYFFPEIFETRQQFPCQPSLPTLFLFYITAAEIRKGTSELVYTVSETTS